MRTRFVARMLLVIAVIAGFNVFCIELLYAFVLNATLREFKLILWYPLPLVLGLVIIYYAVSWRYSRPLLSFLAGVDKGGKPDPALIKPVLERGVNLPYFLGALAVPTYIVGALLGFFYVASKLGYPYRFWSYGLIAGVISGLMTFIMFISGANWAVRPVLDLAMTNAGPDTAGRIGLPLTLRNKFLIIVMALVFSITAYIMTVSYGQTDYLLQNMGKMEELLSATQRKALLDQVKFSQQPGVRSTVYLRAKLGNVMAFYAVMLVAASGLAFFLVISSVTEVTRPVKALRRIAERARKGKYDEPVSVVSNDELADLAQSFNAMKQTIVDRMRSEQALLETLRQGVFQIDQVVGAVLATSRQQASGATEQASSVEESSSIASEIAATARSISDQARNVAGGARGTSDACRDGRNRLDAARADFQGIVDQVESVGEAMARLQGLFTKTYSIAEVMEEIADQVELLALNADLEAAGAGEIGLRFSVVAQETRRLAVSALESSRGIQGLVRGIQQAADEAVKMARSGRDKVATGQRAFQGVADSLEHISSLADSTAAAAREISVSTDQQKQGSEQLAHSVSEVSAVAKEIEQGASEIESAIAELGRLADTLKAAAS